jgi:uncharacterized membrane protein
MDQQDINEQEWKDEGNWVGRRYCRCYNSKKDTRLWVPKSNPMLGWTINFGHKYGVFTLIGAFAIIPVIFIIAVLTIKSSRGH